MKWKRALLAVLCLLIVSLLIVVLDRDRSLSIRFAKLLCQSKKVSRQQTGFKFLFARLGPPRQSVPKLIALHIQGNLSSKILAEQALTRLGMEALPVLRDEFHKGDVQQQEHIAKVLCLLGEPAIQNLIADFTQEDFRLGAEASRVLVKIGAPAVPPLVRALGEQDGMSKWWAATTLGKIRPAPKEAIAPLGSLFMNTDNPLLACAAAQALGEIGTVDSTVLSNLIIGLSNRDPDRRAAAAWALGRIGPAARTAIGWLSIAVNDDDEIVRGNAREALVRIQAHSGGR